MSFVMQNACLFIPGIVPNNMPRAVSFVVTHSYITHVAKLCPTRTSCDISCDTFMSHICNILRVSTINFLNVFSFIASLRDPRTRTDRSEDHIVDC